MALNGAKDNRLVSGNLDLLCLDPSPNKSAKSARQRLCNRYDVLVVRTPCLNFTHDPHLHPFPRGHSPGRVSWLEGL